MERQYSLWQRLFSASRTEEEKAAAARAFLEAAVAAKSPSLLFAANLSVLEHLPEDDPLHVAIAREVAPIVLSMVHAASDETRARCLDALEKSFGPLVSAFSRFAPAQGKRDFIRALASHVARKVGFETHGYFVLSDLAPLLGAWTYDKEAFLDATAVLGKSNEHLCQGGAPRRLHCAD